MSGHNQVTCFLLVNSPSITFVITTENKSDTGTTHHCVLSKGNTIYKNHLQIVTLVASIEKSPPQSLYKKTMHLSLLNFCWGGGGGGVMQISNEKKLIPVLLVQQLLRNCSGSVKSRAVWIQFDARNTMFN